MHLRGRKSTFALKRLGSRRTLTSCSLALLSSIVRLRSKGFREWCFWGYSTYVEGETTYTVDEAAAVLGLSPERIREMLVTGELEGIPPGATLSGEWKVLLPTSLEDGEELSQDVPADESAEENAENAAEAKGGAPPEEEEGAEGFVEPPQSSVGAEKLPARSEEPGANVSHKTSGEADSEPRGEEGASGWPTRGQAARFAGASAETEQMTYVY